MRIKEIEETPNDNLEYIKIIAIRTEFIHDVISKILNENRDKIDINTTPSAILEVLIDGRFSKNIRIDQPRHLHGGGQPHAHVYGRKGEEIVIINKDGTSSHNTYGKLHSADAEALRKRGFIIPPNNIVECSLYDANIKSHIEDFENFTYHTEIMRYIHRID